MDFHKRVALKDFPHRFAKFPRPRTVDDFNGTFTRMKRSVQKKIEFAQRFVFRKPVQIHHGHYFIVLGRKKK